MRDLATGTAADHAATAQAFMAAYFRYAGGAPFALAVRGIAGRVAELMHATPSASAAEIGAHLGLPQGPLAEDDRLDAERAVRRCVELVRRSLRHERLMREHSGTDARR